MLVLVWFSRYSASTDQWTVNVSHGRPAGHLWTDIMSAGYPTRDSLYPHMDVKHARMLTYLTVLATLMWSYILGLLAVELPWSLITPKSLNQTTCRSPKSPHLWLLYDYLYKFCWSTGDYLSLQQCFWLHICCLSVDNKLQFHDRTFRQLDHVHNLCPRAHCARGHA